MSTGHSNHRSHVSTPFISEGRTATNQRRISNGKHNLMYQNIEDSFDNLYRNTAIPDETFGPDEERIFIDVDPYDLNESIFGLQHSSDINSAADATEKVDNKLTARPSIDYIEESLKNVKRQWQESRDEHGNRWSTTSKSHVRDTVMTEPVTSLENDGTDMYYLEEPSARKEVPTKEADSYADDEDKSMNHGENPRTDDDSSTIITSTTITTKNHENRLRISPDQNHHSTSHVNKSTIEYSDAFLEEENEEESDKRKLESRVENRTAIVRFPVGWDLESRGAKEDSTLTNDRPSVIEEASENEDVTLSWEERMGFAEKASSVNLKGVSEGRQRSTDGDGPANALTFTSVTREDNTTKDPVLETLFALGKTY